MMMLLFDYDFLLLLSWRLNRKQSSVGRSTSQFKIQFKLCDVSCCLFNGCCISQTNLHILQFVLVKYFWFKMLLLPSTFAENLYAEEPKGYVDKEVFRSLVLKVSKDKFILINFDDH